MTNLPFDQLWEILGGMLALNPEAFRAAQALRADQLDSLALGIVVLAGISQAMAQAVILFVNRVKPLRFVLSQGVMALLFVVGYLLWVLSIWLAGREFLQVPIPWAVVAEGLAFGYLPLVFSFLGALPYLGQPLLRLLSIWNLLAVVVGFSVLANLTAGQVIWHVGLGWIVLLVLQQTVGQPLVNGLHRLLNRVAGVPLVLNPQQLRHWANQVGPPPNPKAQPLTAPPKAQALERLAVRPGGTLAVPHPGPRQPTSSTAVLPASPGIGRWPRRWRQLFLFSSAALLALITTVALTPLRELLLGWLNPSGRLLAWMVDLVWIALIALVIGGLLAPLEALGWWAGWYGEGVEPMAVTEGNLAVPPGSGTPFRRYIVYLDGVNQATSGYQPAVAQYLAELEQALPADIALVKGLIPYSVLNRSLTEDRPLAFFWRWVETLSAHWVKSVGMIINIRNIMIVGVSADARYGPIYNHGVAQQAYESLLRAGYPHDGGIPLTLIGYSGGGQIAMGIMPFLKQALVAPIEVISLGGVISGNVRALEAEHVYHLAGAKDSVQRLGPILFPRRWPLLFLSYWNRAKRQGKITVIPLGPVGHQVPGGIVDPNAFLPDGRSHLQQTLDLTQEILIGNLRQRLDKQQQEINNPGNYYRFQAAAFNRLDYYPIQARPDAQWYRPIANWVGRLILPTIEERTYLDGVWFEILQAPEAYQSWLGKTVVLRWYPPWENQRQFRAVTRDIHFSAAAEASYRDGLILPTRLNHWRLVTPLESLAGARPLDDVVVQLPEPVAMESQNDTLTLTIAHEPIQTVGRFYALVRFLEPLDQSLERYRVAHFNRASGEFDGLQEVVYLPQVVSDGEGIEAATNRALSRSPLNPTGWYIYGAPNAQGEFVVQALRPRQLCQLQPSQFIPSYRQGRRYLRRESWSRLAEKKGTVESVLIAPQASSLAAALDPWQEGDQALVVHVYGGIGGVKREPAARGPVYFGHFAYGVATVVREPLAQELQFQIRYHQVYTHNRRGLVAGTLDWSLYMGDRQWGFLGTRPVSDILIKLPAYTQPFQFQDRAWSALDDLRLELEVMTARYRTGDGTGVTYVGPANNCAQDSNQAMYASAKHLEDAIRIHGAKLQAWEVNHPDQAQQFNQLLRFRRAIQRRLLPLGSARADWEEEQQTLGSSLSDYPLKTLGRGLMSWRTMLPRKASDTITDLCLSHGASLWVLRTNQVGGYDPDIEPIPPMTL
ncbi:MAG TPA: CAAX protease [Leptolyngbyaceae cyanobacterium M65_K2018_010]|nr:CAAX protease [Leptolyngbyaceae cyanobacterium M65_K2018_010]